MMKRTTRGRASGVPAFFARSTRLLAGVALAAITATACDVHGVSAPGTLSTLTVSPNPQTIAANATQQFTATGTDYSGAKVITSPTWSVVAGGGTISSTGLFTAAGVPGTFANTIKATSGGMTATATVIVTTGALATLVVTPNPQTLVAGSTQQFAAAGSDASGNAVGVTPVWSVAAGGGTITAGGLFTAGSTPGTYANTIKATSGAITATATVTVTATPPAPPPLATITISPNPDTTQVSASQQFVAVGRDGNGNTVAISPVWSIVNAGGTIDAASGRFTAGTSTGTFVNTVKATSGSISGTATVTVLATVPPPSPSLINLGAAAPNGIMAGTAVTCVTGGIINADVSVSPGNTITGFGPCVITGVQHLADATAAQAQIDLTKAYNTLAGLPCPPANAIVANLGGTTKTAGVYCSASTIGVTGTLTLDGGNDPNATFVFQAGSGLTTAGNIVLINGAQAKNVYWQVGTSATIGTASQWQGNIIAYTSITLVDNATLLGRALARNGAVSLGTNNVITLP